MVESCVVFDLEATCWEKGGSPGRMETIEFGAVKLQPESWRIASEFAHFVQPVSNPVLSEFCKQLTSIRQEDVDSALQFPQVFEAFIDWIGTPRAVVCSWGAYDIRQLRVDCGRHKIKFPEELHNHVNLKQEFAAARGMKPCGMKRALRVLGFELEGVHHRGIDDARNIARIAREILPGILEKRNAPEGDQS